jgi:hypothetical protein
MSEQSASAILGSRSAHAGRPVHTVSSARVSRCLHTLGRSSGGCCATALQLRTEVLNEVPCRKPADVEERCAPPHQPRPARNHGIDRVSREHLAAIEHRLTIVERITVADLRLLNGLHAGEPLIELQLAERGPEKVDPADFRLPAFATPSRPGARRSGARGKRHLKRGV